MHLNRLAWTVAETSFATATWDAADVAYGAIASVRRCLPHVRSTSECVAKLFSRPELSNINSRTSTKRATSIQKHRPFQLIIARSQRSKEFCNTIPPTTAVILQCRERQLRADCVVKVFLHR